MILDYYWEEKRGGIYAKNAAEHSQVMGKGFVVILWDPGLGRPHSVEDVKDDMGQPLLDEDGPSSRSSSMRATSTFGRSLLTTTSPTLWRKTGTIGSGMTWPSQRTATR
jgi:hypothetical protein